VYRWCRLAGNVLHQTYPLGYQICSSHPRQKSRSRGPALYVFSLLGDIPRSLYKVTPPQSVQGDPLTKACNDLKIAKSRSKFYTVLVFLNETMEEANLGVTGGTPWCAFDETIARNILHPFIFLNQM
jgi:hypothetical protein